MRMSVNSLKHQSISKYLLNVSAWHLQMSNLWWVFLPKTLGCEEHILGETLIKCSAKKSNVQQNNIFSPREMARFLIRNLVKILISSDDFST